MNNQITIFTVLLSLTLTSCSSLNKSVIYGGATGAITGAIAGRMLSPDKESNNFNAGLGAISGAIVGAGISYLLYKEDPENKTLTTMIVPKENTYEKKKINWDDLGLKINSQHYRVKPDTSNIPEHLKDKVKDQIITEKTIPERVEKDEDGKSVYYPEQKIIEFNYDN